MSALPTIAVCNTTGVRRGYKKKPCILRVEETAKSRLFSIETVALRFECGTELEYERLAGPANACAVIVVPVLADGRVMMIREYAVGTDRYELGLPKGLVDEGESIRSAATRELKEETGLVTSNVKELGDLSLAANFMSFRLRVVLAMDLEWGPAEGGDEPEAPELVPATWQEIREWMADGRIQEARTLAALYKVDVALDLRSQTSSGN
jgi:ADP-ribose diphosphatase